MWSNTGPYYQVNSFGLDGVFEAGLSGFYLNEYWRSELNRIVFSLVSSRSQFSFENPLYSLSMHNAYEKVISYITG
jgi:hypothetical protein